LEQYLEKLSTKTRFCALFLSFLGLFRCLAMVRPTRAEWRPSGEYLLAFISLNGYRFSPVSKSNGRQSAVHLDLSLTKTCSLVDKFRPIEVGRLLAEVLERFHSSSRAITSRCWNNARTSPRFRGKRLLESGAYVSYPRGHIDPHRSAPFWQICCCARLGRAARCAAEIDGRGWFRRSDEIRFSLLH
jgi:hypothetical protein